MSDHDQASLIKLGCLNIRHGSRSFSANNIRVTVWVTDNDHRCFVHGGENALVEVQAQWVVHRRSSCASVESSCPAPLRPQNYFSGFSLAWTTHQMYRLRYSGSSHSPSFKGFAKLLVSRLINFPYPFSPSRPPLSLSHTTFPLNSVHRGHCFRTLPSNGV